MEEGNERNVNLEKPKKYEFFSKSVRAGRRTYFFDVRATQGNDFYITITESKKCISDDGRVFYEKHKIFLYPEDFELYSKGLAQIINYVRNTNFKDAKILKPEHAGQMQEIDDRDSFNKFEDPEPVVESFTNLDVEFDDLGNKQ